MRSVAVRVAFAAAAAVASVAAAADDCCTHLGGSVACPPGLPAGSQSVQFLPNGTGTLWRLPSGATVAVPQTTFPACVATAPAPAPTTPAPPAPPPKPPTTPTTPTAPATPPPSTPPATPPPATPPSVTPPAPPPTQTPSAPPQTQTPRAPPTDGGRGSEDRARRLLEPPTPPISVPVTPPDDGTTTDDLIRRRGQTFREQPPVTPPVVPPTVPKTPPEQPPTKTPPDQPPPYGPPEEPPTKVPEYPPTKGPGKQPPVVCCGIADKLITYPFTIDPMQPPARHEAPRDPAVGGMQVFLHDGGFFANALDIGVPKFFYNMQWSRHYRSDAKFKGGGLMGHGWDFFFNKRVVPWGRPHRDGLRAERMGEDIPTLTYYSGTGRAELYAADPGRGGHSEFRDVENFDTAFRAYVSTYVSPNGAFHEIERYVLLDGQPHPFGEHRNVEKTERIFYVLREKDGTRYVFNCRGQLIYVLSRNDSPGKRIRVELRYREPLNPLTQNPMLFEIVPAVGKAWQVDVVEIGRGTVSTNLNCTVRSGTYPILRVKRLRTETTTITYEYKGGDEPVLESVKKAASDPKSKYKSRDRQWRYAYEGNKLTDITNPNESAKGASGKPWIHNVYAGESVASQTLGGENSVKPDVALGLKPIATSPPQSFAFKYGATTTVTDAMGNTLEYEIGDAGGFPVVASLTVRDRDPANGGPWTTRYKHNRFTQIEEITHPAGNGVTFEYETANKPVTEGPIRDWVERKWTYENNLQRGNLLSVTQHEANMGAMVVRDPGVTYSGPSTSRSERRYDPLYNQIVKTVDALSNVTTWAITDYHTPKHRGNPLSMQDPPVLQPDGKGTTVERPEITFTYDAFAQPETVTEGDVPFAKYEYNEQRYIRRVDYRGGAFENLRYDALGNIVSRTTQDGTVDYAHDPMGQPRSVVVDPGGLKLATETEYDDNGNAIEVRREIKDTFGSPEDAKAAADKGLKVRPTYWQVEASAFDLLDREVTRTVSALGAMHQSVYGYERDGNLAFTLEPPRNDLEPYRTAYRYDARNRIVETTTAEGTSAAHTVRRKFDANGNLAAVESGSGADATRSTLHHNGLDRIDLATDVLGAVRNVVYDAAGNLVEQTIKGKAGTLQHARYEYNAYGQVILRAVDTLDAGAQEVTKWFYSDRLLLAKTASPNGSETIYEYDRQNRLEYVTDALSNQTRNVYNDAGHLVRVEVTATERGRDDAGRPVEAKRTSTTTTTYDRAGRVVAVATAAGREQRFLDSVGRTRGALSPTGQMTVMTYDGLGRMTELGNGLTRVSKKYTAGSLVRMTDGPDGNYTFGYDAAGRVVSRTDQESGATLAYKYDGRAVETTDGNGTVVRTTYNAGKLPVDVTATPGTRTRIPRAPSFAVVRGATREHFDYDELGRITSARTGEPGQPDSAVVERKQDGLSRLTQDSQSLYGVTHAVAYRYAQDFTWVQTDYPSVAAGRYRSHADALGRVVRLTIDEAPVARYTYSGLDRISSRVAGNGIETHYGFDAAYRLIQMSLEHSSDGVTRVPWLVGAAYDAVGMSLVSELAPGPDGSVGTITRIKRDALGRVTSSTTGALADARWVSTPPRPGAEPSRVSGTLAEMSGSYNVYDGAKLAAMAEYGGVAVPRPGGAAALDVLGCLNAPVSCGQGAPVRMLRLDRFAYDGRRIARVTTSGASDGRVQAFPGGVDAVAGLVQVRDGIKDLFVAGSRTPPTDQAFLYDGNGNVVDDGRYLYAYDFKNRLTLVQDTWAPNGYDEFVGFVHDAFDRRVAVYNNRVNRSAQVGSSLQFNLPFSAGTTRLVYDGNHVIAETFTASAGNAAPALVARYFHGARAGELVRMDARPTDAPTSPLATYYVHEDLNGMVRYVSDGQRGLHSVDNDTSLGSGRVGAEAPPGDRMLISASLVGDKVHRAGRIRMPYLGSGTRVDGFAATVWRDEMKQPVFNWRHAANFVRATERRAISDQRLMQQNQMQATVGLMIALPVAAAAAIPAASPYAVSQVSWGSLGLTAAAGGAVQTGFGYGMSLLTGAPYGPAEAGLDFVQGASFAVAGHVIGPLGMGSVAKAATEQLAFTSLGMGWGVARGGRLDADMVAGSLVMGVAAQGAFAGVAWAGRQTMSALFGALFDAAESVPRLPAAVMEEIRPMTSHFSESLPSAPKPAPPTPKGFYINQGVPVTAEIKAAAQRILGRLEASRIPIVMEAADRVRSGALKVVMYGKGQKHRDPGTRMGYDTTRWDGYWVHGHKDTIWINLDKLVRGPGAINDLWAASVVIHETIHAMGGNEACAFFGQARFLAESGQALSAIPTPRLRAFHFTYLKNDLSDALQAIGSGPSAEHPGGIMNYRMKGNWLEVGTVNSITVQQLGWARALLAPHPGFDAWITAVTALP